MPQTMTAPTSTTRTERLTQSAFSSFGEVIANPANFVSTYYASTVANQGSATKFLDVTHMESHYHLSRSQRPAKVSMNLFVCKPRVLQTRPDGKEIFPVKILERHPFTSQTFAPIGLGRGDKSTRYLVIVAPTLPSDSKQNAPGRGVRRRRSLKEAILGVGRTSFGTNYSPGQSSPSTRPKGPGLPDLNHIKAFIASGDQAVTYGPGTWHAPMVVIGERPVDFLVVQYANGVSLEDCQEVEMDLTSDSEGLNVEIEPDTSSDHQENVRANL